MLAYPTGWTPENEEKATCSRNRTIAPSNQDNATNCTDPPFCGVPLVNAGL